MTETETCVAPEESPSPGRALAQLRHARNLTIAEVAQRLKYAERQIEALENDDFPRLPGMPIVRGMIRSYSRLLGAEPAPILLGLERMAIPPAPTVDLPSTSIPFPDGRKRATRVYALLSALAALIAVVLGYELLPGDDRQVTETAESRVESPSVSNEGIPLAEAPAPMVEIAPAAAAAGVYPEQVNAVVSAAVALPEKASAVVAAGTRPVQVPQNRKTIALRFDRDAWVEIRQADGRMLLSQLNPAGTKQIVAGVPPFALVIGNAPNVHVSYEDQPVDLKPHFKVDVARLTLE